MYGPKEREYGQITKNESGGMEKDMERGQIYFNKYVDSMGKPRKIPVVVVSEDVYNDNSDFATCVRMVREVNGISRPTHVPVPKDAMKITDAMVELTNGTVLAETIGSVRKTNLVGPIGRMDSDELMRKIADAITSHVGAGWEGKPKREEPEVMTSEQRPTKDCPWYSPQIQKEQEIGPYGKSSVRIAGEHDIPEQRGAKITEPAYGYDGTGMTVAERTDAGSRRFGPGAEG